MRLTESISIAEVESIFRQQALRVWKNASILSKINFTFLLVPNQQMNGKVLMSVGYSARPMAIGDSLISVPNNITVRVNERLFELTPEQQLKIIIHEVVHIGYSNHDANFIRLCAASGGAPSELSATGEEGYKVQLKQGARYVTVKTFPLTMLGQEQARAFGREEMKKHNTKARIVI